MIEFMVRYPWGSSEWLQYKLNWSDPTKANIAVYKFRIDGVIYEKDNAEFRAAFVRTKIWDCLQL